MRYFTSFASGGKVLLTMVALSCAEPAIAAQKNIDLTGAVIVTPPGLSGPEKKAVTVLIEEVEKRTQLRWRQSETWPADNVPVIVVGQVNALQKFATSNSQKFESINSKPLPEGYEIQLGQDKGTPVVWVAGNDSRGVLFGVGRLLRVLVMEKRSITAPANLKIATAPHYPVRGHQLGYRPKTNAYDAWNVAQWDQYIRELAVFGTNSIELIPPRSDDEDDSPHFPLPKMDMMVAMSKICDDYGLDVWIWYPALDKDYSDPNTVESALKEWAEVFKKLPRVDAIFVPGGDPGHTQPRYLMALLEKQTEVLHRYHPKATMWVAPQSFSSEWMDEFLAIMKTEPAWLTGIVYGPQTRLTLPQLRAAVPTKYPIRHYPDITHSRTAQYPVPEWDVAYAITEAREIINPRAVGESQIFRSLQKYTNGFITYSEGCNDDVNKIVWSLLGWSPEADVADILRDYSHFFIGPKQSDSFAQGLLALEKNWVGPILTNASIYSTLQQFQVLEKAASPQDRLNWRFQQALYRAYYDAYVRSRLIYETQLEDEAMSKLRLAPRIGSPKAMVEAENVLARAVSQPVSEDWRARVFELGEALYQSIHMQLSVDRYQAIAVGRGANLDTIDRPLNSRAWLVAQFNEIRRAEIEADRLKKIDQIINWTNPGPGGFYDDLGNPSNQPHLVRGLPYAEDPAFFVSPAIAFEDRPALRKSWWDQSMAHYDAPLHVRYTGLDPTAHYKVRAVYGSGPMRCEANEKLEVHPLVNKPYELVEFDIPSAASSDGTLNLRWYGKPGRGGNGRGCQIAEVWLIKK